jgi:hypothetical protein
VGGEVEEEWRAWRRRQRRSGDIGVEEQRRGMVLVFPPSGNVGERSWFCFVLVSFLSRLHCLSPMELSKNYEQCHYTLDPLLPYSTARLQGRRSRRSARLAVGIGGSGIPLPSSPLLATAHRPVLQSPHTVLPPNQPPSPPSPAHKGHAFFHQRAPPIARNPGRPILQRYFGLDMDELDLPELVV